MTQLPAARPCGTCPYRRDVPAGIWHAQEYDKLPAYDQDTPYQPTGMFQCHQHGRGDEQARLCAGWVGCHGDQLLALRLGVAMGRIPAEVFAYTTLVPLFASGAEAAAHGKAGIARPTRKAVRASAKIMAKRGDVGA